MADRKPEWDVVIPQTPTEDGRGVRGVRSRPEGYRQIVVRPAVDGQPVLPGHSLLRMHPRPDGALDVVETLYESPETPDATLQHAGPPKVASDAYRAGYEAIDWGAGRRQNSHGAN